MTAVQADAQNLAGRPVGEVQPILVPARRLDESPAVKQRSHPVTHWFTPVRYEPCVTIPCDRRSGGHEIVSRGVPRTASASVRVVSPAVPWATVPKYHGATVMQRRIQQGRVALSKADGRKQPTTGRALMM